MTEQAIGVFDSGLGGLTAVKQLMSLVPGENIIYFGDTARLPYGNRGRGTILRYAKQDIAFLLSQNVKLLIDACGTMSSVLEKALTDSLPVPYVGVIEAASRAAVSATKNGRVGIIATAATVASRSFQDAIGRLDKEIKIIAKACPLFVPLVENGYINRDNEVTAAVAREYLSEIKRAGVDTLVLGCTHYPIIAGIISDVMGLEVTLVDSGLEAAKEAVGMLVSPRRGESAEPRLFTSDQSIGFEEIASMFLGREIKSAGQIDIESVVPWAK